MSERKELNYFSYGMSPNYQAPAKVIQPVRSKTEYESHFSGADHYIIRGEASPSYFSTTGSATRIKQQIPGVKLITTLRNPAERAYSGYLMNLRTGNVKPNDPHPFSADKHWVKLSFYFERLKEYYDQFDHNQIKIVLLENMKSDRKGVLTELFDFLGIDSQYDFSFGDIVHNPASQPKNYLVHNLINNNQLVKKHIRPLIPRRLKNIGKRIENINKTSPVKLPDPLREDLNRLYEDDIRKVEDLTGVSLDTWR